MRILMRFMAMLTLVAFTCAVTGCAASHQGAVTSRHSTQTKTQASNIGKDEGAIVDESSNSNSSEVTVMFIAGLVVATAALIVIVTKAGVDRLPTFANLVASK